MTMYDFINYRRRLILKKFLSIILVVCMLISVIPLGFNIQASALRYSIESYAYNKVGAGDEKLSNLLIAMMKYGNSANKYVNWKG